MFPPEKKLVVASWSRKSKTTCRMAQGPGSIYFKAQLRISPEQCPLFLVKEQCSFEPHQIFDQKNNPHQIDITHTHTHTHPRDGTVISATFFCLGIYTTRECQIIFFQRINTDSVTVTTKNTTDNNYTGDSHVAESLKVPL